MAYNAWAVLFYLFNWLFVYQYTKAATLAPIVFTSKYLSGRDYERLRSSKRCLLWLNVGFIIALAAVFTVNQLFFAGVLGSLYDLLWVALTGLMIHSMRKIRRTMKMLERSNFLTNERLMKALGVLYVLLALSNLAVSIAGHFGSRVEAAENGREMKSSGWYRTKIVSDAAIELQMFVGFVIQILMAHMFAKFSRPYDPVLGRVKSQKEEFMVVF